MTAPFDGPGSRWFTIPSHRPFVDDLAGVLYRSLAGTDAEALTDAIVLTPTRRGARALAEAFVKAAGGRPVLLPQIRAVGDLDEGEPPFEPGAIAASLPPAVTPLRRRFELARLIGEHRQAIGRDLDAPSALEMADALAGFMDSLWIEEKFEGADVESLASSDQAKHWARSAKVLAIGLTHWPERLKQIGLIDPTDRRVRLSKLLAAQWRERPPGVPLIAAGSTGTAPATADLLAAVAAAPRGCVVLPGLDKNLADEAWEAVDEQHPQGAMKRLLERHALSRADVADWPREESQADRIRGRARRRVINEALRPAKATADWLKLIEELKRETDTTGVDPFRQGLDGLAVVTARSEEEAATVAALLMREALETPDRTCALVTPDQDLARRVSARLARWGVEADSSAGAPLASFPVGVLTRLMAELACDPADPVALLGVLKSPLVRLGEAGDTRQAEQDAFERQALRGARRDGWPSLFRVLENKRKAGRGGPPRPQVIADLDLAWPFAVRLHGSIAPLADAFAGGAIPAPDAARALVDRMEAFAADEAGDPGGLWGGPAGQAAARLLAGIIEDGAALPAVTAGDFRDLLFALLAEETVRPGGATHPRLKILGAIEARLVRADRLILAGLEEGTWPQGAPVDPFLSRPMRKRLGLPAPERKVGLSAHDFAQAACAPEVILLSSERRGGQPAVPSRWLWRLKTLAAGAGVTLPGREDVLDWARALDAALTDPPLPLTPAPRPAPRPPLEARPTQLAVTQVEAWVRDPYAVYARNVLKLYPLDRPDEPVDARARGTAIHSAMEDFSEEWPTLAEADRASRFADLYLTALRDAGAPETDLARETPLAARAGAWIAAFEAERRRSPIRVLVEREVRLAVPGVNFTLTARADRIEIAGGLAHVIDFKTGGAPSKRQVLTGFAGQLPLTAAMLQRGGLPEAGRSAPGDLLYVQISGREPPGKLEERGRAGKPTGVLPPSEEMAERSWTGFVGLVKRYGDPAQAYASRTAPEQIRYKSDYDHLARVREWSVSGDDEDGDADNGSGGDE